MLKPNDAIEKIICGLLIAHLLLHGSTDKDATGHGNLLL